MITFGGNGRFSSKCNFTSQIFCGEKQKKSRFGVFWAETGYSLQSATLDFALFDGEKVHEKPFAAQSPPRKRGLTVVSSTQIFLVGENVSNLRNRVLRSLRCRSFDGSGIKVKFKVHKTKLCTMSRHYQ